MIVFDRKWLLFSRQIARLRPHNMSHSPKQLYFQMIIVFYSTREMLTPWKKGTGKTLFYFHYPLWKRIQNLRTQNS